MASALNKQNKMKRMESRKSHSWWWDSHISPKNSKWLQENLDEMDQSVKRMLKLIEEDGDSFAKKAEMYYKKRPELISLVEEFYRIYRSLAERYDHVTGELRKNVPSDLHSQGSGLSDVGSEPPSSLPSPDQRPLTRRKSGPRAAGFDVFLGTGGSSLDSSNKEGDESSTLDSESDSDDSSVNNYSSIQSTEEEQGLRRKITQLENELRHVKEKSRVLEEQISGGSMKSDSESSDALLAKVAAYEEELNVSRKKLQLSEEEISRLTVELQNYKSLDESTNVHAAINHKDAGSEVENSQIREVQESIDRLEAEGLDPTDRIKTLEAQLKIKQEELHKSEKEVANLLQELTKNGSSSQRVQDQLKSAQKEISAWKTKLEKEKKEVSKLNDRIARYKSNLADRDQEIRGLKEAISNANKSLSEENEHLQAEITRVLKERAYLEDNLKELDLRCQTLEEDVRRVKAGKEEIKLVLGAQIEQLKVDVAEKNNHVEELNKSFDALKLKYDMLMTEKDNLDAKIAALSAEMNSKDDQLDQMKRRLDQLQLEHVEVITGSEESRKLADELHSRVEELEREVERQKEIIMEGAEEKREAIRQLCFSIDHYRNGYHELRQAVVGHKRFPVMAS